MSDPRIDEYEALVRHHLACERITEEMAMLLGHVAEGHKPSDLGLRIAHVLSSWEAHQWPDLRSGVSGPSDLTLSPVANMALTIALARFRRGEDIEPNTAAALALELERIRDALGEPE